MTDAAHENWRAIALSTVDEATLRSSLAGIGWAWGECAHITATESMARTLRESGARAISIVELIDVIVWDAMPNAYRIPIVDYPRSDRGGSGTGGEPGAQKDPIRTELTQWRRNISQRRLALGIRMDNCLRRHLRFDAVDPGAARVLRMSVRDLRVGLGFLSSAGFRPDDFATDDMVVRVAVEAWKVLEHEIPETCNLRRDLWTDPSLITHPSDEASRGLRARIDEALQQVFGDAPGTRKILLHGFYFFTPPQWALFGLLRAVPSVRQCFVIHDDGTNRAFETWRRYFRERWRMPRVEYRETPRRVSRATLLAAALEGRRVDPGAIPGEVSVVKCKNVTEFVRHRNEEKMIARAANEPRPALFAPAADEINRVLDRMGVGQPQTGVNLANLPIGQFLLALHECVEFDPTGEHELTLAGDRLIDMAASGFLNSPKDAVPVSSGASALRRALPFFSDLRSIEEWCLRAEALERLVKTEIAMLGPRADGQSDVERISVAVGNELRLAPWCDLTDAEAVMVKNAIHRARDLVDEIVSDGMRRPDRYLEWVRKRLQQGLGNLTPDERAEVEQKLTNVGLAMNEDLDLEGVSEVVQMILGREVEIRRGDGLEGDESLEREAREMRFVDVLGFRRADHDVHVANLSDTLFPGSANPYPWPFSENRLKPGSGEPVSIELLRTRIETAPLEGLYLFWLLMDGVAESRRITLSWIAERGGETENPSSLLSLLTEIVSRRPAVRAVSGGIPIGPAARAVPGSAIRTAPATRPWSISDPEEKLILAAVTSINRVAVSSALACQRRLPIQWIVGPSASFQSSHNQAMLFGNVQGALMKRNRFAGRDQASRERKVNQLTKDLWRHLTRGQRKSSHFKRAIRYPGGAYWQWVFSLGGFSKGTDPLDLAYRVATGNLAAEVGDLISNGHGLVLPAPTSEHDHGVCDNCPVAPRCAGRVFPDRT